MWGACPVPGLELPSPGSGGVDLGAVPVAEMMDNLKSYTPRCEIKDLRNNIKPNIGVHIHSVCLARISMTFELTRVDYC